MTNHAAIVAELQSRWPENRVGPSRARIRALTDLLGSPERTYPVIQITGTNGKGSTAIMIERLLIALGLRVGRFSSPHLQDLTERISLDGEPIDAGAFDALVADVMPLVEIVDAQAIDGISMTFFEVMTGLAFEAFAQAPVDVAVVEVGLGGAWDATSVADAAVAVVTPVDLDHTHLLGRTTTEIATEKAGIIKPGSWAVLAAQTDEVSDVLAARCAEVGARVWRAGVDFGLIERTPAVGGQVLRLQGAGGPVGDIVLPLFGRHMAENAALAVGAVEAFLGGKPLVPDVIAEGIGAVSAPARLEVVRRGPTVVLDTAHNPHGVRATLDGLDEAFAFEPLIAVVGMMADKDVEGVLELLAEPVTTLICTQASDSSRAVPASELAERAEDWFGTDRVHTVVPLADALDQAVALADDAGPSAGVLVVGSVVVAGEARGLLASHAAQAADEGAYADSEDDEW